MVKINGKNINSFFTISSSILALVFVLATAAFAMTKDDDELNSKEEGLVKNFGSLSLKEKKATSLTLKKQLKQRANKGNAEAQDTLGELYWKEKKDDKAFKWFTESATRENASGQNHLGMLYAWKNNSLEALKWYKKSNDQGFKMAQVNMGILYYNEKEYSKAFTCFKKSAKRGFAPGQYHFGMMYDDGPGQQQGLPKSRGEAAKWYTLSANQGYTDAQRAIGGMYLVGQGVNQSYEEALKYYTLAANQGHLSALYEVGLMHAKGYGTAQSYENGLKWCRLAAEKGHANAKTLLGWTDENGHCIDQPFEEALKLFSIAIAKQNVETQKHLDFLYEFYRDRMGGSHEEAMKFLQPCFFYTYKDQTAQYELDQLLGKSNWYCTIQ